jgi:23S rRNA G2445 N2-methylase RlmL
MKALAITDKGLEKIAVLEIDELIGTRGKGKSKTKASECAVLFECKSPEEIFKFCYMAQSVERVLLLFDSYPFKDLKDLESKFDISLKKIKLKDWFDKSTRFRVSCKRTGKHKFGSHTIEEDLGEKIIIKSEKELGFAPKASMETPDLIFYVFINKNQAYLGVDLIGRDLSKRQYKVFSAPGIINANLGYALARLGGYAPKKKMLDVVCKTGVVCIEAGLYASRHSINYYSKDFLFKKLKPFKEMDWDALFRGIDSKADTKARLDILGVDPTLRNVESANKNAKLAGISKLISFSKMEVEWLDTKLDKASVDLIASRIPCPSKHTPEAGMKKLYKELFYIAEFIMKEKGKIVLLSEHTRLLKSMITPAFKLITEDGLWAGKQRYELVIIEKK